MCKAIYPLNMQFTYLLWVFLNWLLYIRGTSGSNETNFLQVHLDADTWLCGQGA